jgi:hypothetical protein
MKNKHQPVTSYIKHLAVSVGIPEHSRPQNPA